MHCNEALVTLVSFGMCWLSDAQAYKTLASCYAAPSAAHPIVTSQKPLLVLLVHHALHDWVPCIILNLL